MYLATECNTSNELYLLFIEGIVLHLQRWLIPYSIAVHACSAENNYFVKKAISALPLSTHRPVTALTTQAVEPKNHTT